MQNVLLIFRGKKNNVPHITKCDEDWKTPAWTDRERASTLIYRLASLAEKILSVSSILRFSVFWSSYDRTKNQCASTNRRDAPFSNDLTENCVLGILRKTHHAEGWLSSSGNHTQ